MSEMSNILLFLEETLFPAKAVFPGRCEILFWIEKYLK